MAGGDRVGDASIVEVLSKRLVKKKKQKNKRKAGRGKKWGYTAQGKRRRRARKNKKKKKSRIICSNFRSYFPIQIRAFQPPFASGSLTPGMKILPFFCSGAKRSLRAITPRDRLYMCFACEQITSLALLSTKAIPEYWLCSPGFMGSSEASAQAKITPGIATQE